MFGQLGASVLRLGVFGAAGPSAPPSVDPDAVTLIAAMSVQPDAARRGLYNDLIVGLKADGVWSLIDCLYIFAAHDVQAARLNIRARAFDATEVNSPGFTTDRGYTFSGSAHLDTTFNPATASAPQFAQNSAHASAYVNLATTDTGSTAAVIGQTSAGTGSTLLRPRSGTNNVEGRLNMSSNINFGVVGSRLGFFTLSRTASNLTTAYRESAVAGTSSSASAAPQSASLWFGRLTTSTNTQDRVAAGSFGAALSAAQETALRTRVVAYLGAIGAA